VPTGRPEAPIWLTEAGKAEWDYVIYDLEKSGCLANVDRTMLGMYAALTAELAKDPKEFTAAKYTQLRLICGELGFSISSRLKLRQPEGVKEPETCKPKQSANLVSISSLLSRTPKASAMEVSTPATTFAAPAKDS